MPYKKYAIMSPVMGTREDVPGIILDDAYIPESKNVRFLRGAIRKAKMRNPVLSCAGAESHIPEQLWSPSKTYSTGDIVEYGRTASAVTYVSGSVSMDPTLGGTLTHTYDANYKVMIDGVATPDTFKWSNDGGLTWDAETVAITGAAQSLDNGLEITFPHTDGYALNTTWTFTVTVNYWESAVDNNLNKTPQEDANWNAATPTTYSPILAYHWLEKKNGTNYLFAFTKNSIYKWVTGAPGYWSSWLNTGMVRDVSFVGSGLDDALSGGTFTGTADTNFRVQIDGNGIPDTFKWSNDGGSSWEASTVAITGAAQTLENGVTVAFAATTGHTIGDYWDIDAYVSINLTDTEHWFVVTMNDLVIATNGQDKVVYGDYSDKFDWLGGDSGIEYASGVYLTAAKYITVFENYVIVGYTTENSVDYPYRVRWCDLGDHTTWDSGDGGAADVGEADALSGFGQYKSFLFIFKERSFHRMWLTDSSLIFAINAESKEIGCLSPHSIVNGTGGELYFFANNFTFREIQLGEISEPISKTVSADNIPISYVEHIQAKYIPEYDEIWWAIPDGASQTENNNLLVYKPDKRRWTIIEMDIRAFGRYEQNETYTWDTLPYESWDQWHWERWNSAESNAGYIHDIGADYDGGTNSLHNAFADLGSSTTSYFILETDFAQKGMLATYKRLLFLDLYFKGRAGGTVGVYVKRDNESAWQTLDATLSIKSNKGIGVFTVPCDVRAKSFQIKIESTNDFQFYGLIAKFIAIGDR